MPNGENITYWIILASFIMPLLLAIALIWFIVSYQRKKYAYELEKKDLLVLEQAHIIEKQELIEKERTRIASEMHDDLGSGLTTIRFLSEKALRNVKTVEESDQIMKISDYSNKLIQNMSEIIWAMNSRFDNLTNLIGYIRRYASEYLEENEIELEFEAVSHPEEITISGEKRRNLFLIVKELLHNAVKHSKAAKIKIQLTTDDNFKISILEVGSIGFDRNQLISKGNGLYNMEKRIHNINGQLEFKQLNIGMLSCISYPLLSDSK
ncbi:MAG TPA: histidine kinase [Saprospiraceae bacterium]|nr:histidine kinase [Saprospiraceae bacterium]